MNRSTLLSLPGPRLPLAAGLAVAAAVAPAQYPSGTHTLSFTVGGDPTAYTTQFVIKRPAWRGAS